MSLKGLKMGAHTRWALTMVPGVVNMLFNNMSTGLRDEGATVSNRVFRTPNASGESKCILKRQYAIFVMSKTFE